MVIVVMLIVIMMFGVIGVGNFFYQCWDVQCIVDMVVFVVVQWMDDVCLQLIVIVISNVQFNGFNVLNGDMINIECGCWDMFVNLVFSYYVVVVVGIM